MIKKQIVLLFDKDSTCHIFSSYVFQRREMTTPLWFQLIERWVPEGMGTTGVTLPFLVGALNYAKQSKVESKEHIYSVVDQMIATPVSGFTVVVSNCPNIDYLVLSVSPVKRAPSFNGCVLLGPNQAPALGFCPNAQAGFWGLDSNDPATCKQRFVEKAHVDCASGNFSRQSGENTRGFIFGPFKQKEIEYIERLIDFGESKT